MQRSEGKTTSPSVKFDQRQVESGISKIGDWKMQGGFFWNRKRTLDIREIEEKAFDKILAFAYVGKYQKSTAYDDVRRVQVFRQLTGDNMPRFAASQIMKVKEKSVTDNVYFHNAINEKEIVYRPKSLRTSHFDLIQSDKIRLRQPIDFTKFLQLKPLKREALLTMLSKPSPDDSNSVMRDKLLLDIIDRTPFFLDAEDFSKCVAQINSLSYIKRAYVHYIFAEYYGQVFYRSASLYNVEMMTYYATLFASFEVKVDLTMDAAAKKKLETKIKRLTKIRESLKKGDGSKDIVNALANDGTSAYTGLVDPATGLPLNSPLLYHRAGAWPFKKKDAPADFSKLKFRSVAQMAELLLNEPLIEETDPINQKKTMKQAFMMRAYEPVLSTDMSGVPDDSIDKSLIYIEDVKAKMLIAMREVRKNLILHTFHSSTNPEDSGDTQVMERLQKEFDIRAANADVTRRQTSIEHGFDDVFEHVFKPAYDRLNETVNANIAAASKNIQTMKVSKTSSYLGASDLFLSASDLSPWGNTSRAELSIASISPLLGSKFSAIGRRIPL